MLILNRGYQDTIIIGDGESAVEVVFLGMSPDYPDQARIGIKADKNIPVHRKEVRDRIVGNGRDVRPGSSAYKEVPLNGGQKRRNS